MITFSTAQIPPPSDWNAFESLCRDLWAAAWKDNNAQKHGRSGQEQCGVDVYGKDYNNAGNNCGIQCKGKDNYLNKKVSVKELENEVNKAKNFRPSISTFILATTGPKDVTAETRAREITEENSNSGQFSVHVFGWQDIKELLEHHPSVLKHHYKYLSEQVFIYPNEYIFEIWDRALNIKTLQHTCNYLPFGSHDVKFEGKFVNDLQSFILKIDEELLTPRGAECTLEFGVAIKNFTRTAHELIEECMQVNNVYEFETGIFRYRVEVTHLQYGERGDYIEYRKGVVRCLFYHLIKAANYVIKLNNKTGYPQVRYVPFRDSFAHNAPFFGDPLPSPEYFPQYQREEIELGLYPGIFEIDKFIRLQVYGEKSEFLSL